MKNSGKIVPKKKPTMSELHPERTDKKCAHIEQVANSMRKLKSNINKELRHYINGL